MSDIKYRILIDDGISGRWTKGEIGTALPNEMPDKYDVYLRLEGTIEINAPEGWPLRPGRSVVRAFYFHQEEVERVT